MGPELVLGVMVSVLFMPLLLGKGNDSALISEHRLRMCSCRGSRMKKKMVYSENYTAFFSILVHSSIRKIKFSPCGPFLVATFLCLLLLHRDLL